MAAVGYFQLGGEVNNNVVESLCIGTVRLFKISIKIN